MNGENKTFPRWFKQSAHYLGLLAGIASSTAILLDQWGTVVLMGLAVFDLWLFWLLVRSVVRGIVAARSSTSEKPRTGLIPALLLLFVLVGANGALVVSGYIGILLSSAIYGEPFPPLGADERPHYRDHSIAFVVGHDWYGSFLMPPVEPSQVQIRKLGLEKHLSIQEQYDALEHMESSSIATIYLSGQSAGDPVFVDHKVLIKVLSYAPVPPLSHWGLQPIGGAGSVNWLHAIVSPRQAQSKERIFSAYPIDFSKEDEEWLPSAEYPNIVDLDARDRFLLSSGRHATIPREILSSFENTAGPVPDYFALTGKEALALGISVQFTSPGIYEVQYGIEYSIGRYRTVAWASPPSRIYVAGDFLMWHPVLSDGPDGDRYYQMELCIWGEGERYHCSEVCRATIDTNGVVCPK